MAFLPDNYTPPPKTGGHYFKPQDGENRVRIIGSAIVGWVGWDKTGDQPKPVRVGMDDAERIQHLNTADDRVSHFWAFPVVDRADEEVKIWEVTQATIRDGIESLIDDADWGHPGAYDIVITRTGKGKDGTKYSVIPKPKVALDLTDRQKDVNQHLMVGALLTGDDPFVNVPEAGPPAAVDSFSQDTADQSTAAAATSSPGAVDDSDIPFAPFA